MRTTIAFDGDFDPVLVGRFAAELRSLGYRGITITGIDRRGRMEARLEDGGVGDVVDSVVVPAFAQVGKTASTAARMGIDLEQADVPTPEQAEQLLAEIAETERAAVVFETVVAYVRRIYGDEASRLVHGTASMVRYPRQLCAYVMVRLVGIQIEHVAGVLAMTPAHVRAHIDGFKRGGNQILRAGEANALADLCRERLAKLREERAGRGVA